MIFPQSVYTYPRQVQLIPMGDWLSTQYPSERIKRLQGIFSVKLGESIKDTRDISKTIKISNIQGSRSKLSFEFNGIPTQEESTHRELNDLLLSEFPETNIAIRLMTTVNKTPSILNDVSNDEILMDYEKYGSHTNFLIRRGFVNIRNPYYLMKNELGETWNPKWSRQLRGVLAGKKPYILEGTQRDFLYGKCKKRYILLTQLDQLNRQLVGNWVSKDIAIPSNDNVIIGGVKLPISIYTLLKRQTQISMGYDIMNIESLI